MRSYLSLMKKIVDHGEERADRTGTGTIGLFGEQLKIDLAYGFPLLTTKRMPFRSVAAELLWFLRGETHVESLQADGCTIWDEWATEEQCARFGRHAGDLGPIYGWQWRSFGRPYQNDGLPHGEPGPLENGCRGGFDQIRWLVEEIKKNPNSRRLVVSAWNPEDAARVTLPPCHTLFQCYVSKSRATDNIRAWQKLRDGKEYDPDRSYEEKSRLSLHLYMRSADYFLGVPFNIASYALLTHMIARECDLAPGTLTVSFGDVHLYKNHLDQAREQLSREPLKLPEILIRSPTAEFDMFHVQLADVSIDDYHHYPAIKASVSV